MNFAEQPLVRSASGETHALRIHQVTPAQKNGLSMLEANELDKLHPNIAQAVTSWRAKPSLRAVYQSFYETLAKNAPPGGKVLEIGAGSGHSRDFFAGLDVTRLDILPAPWVDIVCDAHDIPLPDQSFDAIVMIDVLHHLSNPMKFFAEASRLLRSGGRFAMIEPGITLLSGALYKRFHEEPVIMDVDPTKPAEYGPDKDPFESNQAIPTLLFKRDDYRLAFERARPDLKIVETKWMSLAAYPMTGGFQPWTLLTPALARFALTVERAFEPLLGPIMAFRLLVILEKQDDARPR